MRFFAHIVHITSFGMKKIERITVGDWSGKKHWKIEKKRKPFEYITHLVFYLEEQYAFLTELMYVAMCSIQMVLFSPKIVLCRFFCFAFDLEIKHAIKIQMNRSTVSNCVVDSFE